MAGIDKIYVTSVEDWLTFRNWCIRNRRKCWNKTHLNLLHGWYATDARYVNEWLEEVRKKDIEYYDECRKGLANRDSYEFYNRFTCIPFDNKSIKSTEDYSKLFKSCLPPGSENWRKHCVVDKWAVERLSEVFEEWGDKNPPSEIPMTNFPYKIDRWLIRHCPIEFVRKRLKEQYSKEFDNIKLGKIFK